jgi:hypothetical protein
MLPNIKKGLGCSRCGRCHMHTKFWWKNLMERVHLEDLGVDVRILLKHIFKKWDWEEWTGLIWLMIGTVNGLL